MKTHNQAICGEAATALGLSDTSAGSQATNGKPDGCRYKSTSTTNLKVNTDTTENTDCSTDDACLCVVTSNYVRGSGHGASISAGRYFSMVILHNHTIKAWGENSKGELGYGDTTERGYGANEMGNRLPIVNLGSNARVVEVSAGGVYYGSSYQGVHACARMEDGTVKCWGENDRGQLGKGDTNDEDDPSGLSAINLGTGRTALQVAAGGRHSCALLDDATVKCWGRNDYGEAGIGSTSSSISTPGNVMILGTGRSAVEVCAGGFHTCVRLDNNEVKCSGWNGRGSLGTGGTSSQSTPVLIDFGNSLKAKAISCGGYHTCAILENDELKCWGYNNAGQLGLGDTNHRGDDANEMGTNLDDVDLGNNLVAVKVSAGDLHTCAILNDGSVKCWGKGSNGRLGHGATTHLGNQNGQMGDSLGEVDLGTGRTAVEIAAGYDHTCARLDDGSVKCWGEGDKGALGSESTSDIGNGSGEMGDDLLPVDLGVWV